MQVDRWKLFKIKALRTHAVAVFTIMAFGGFMFIGVDHSQYPWFLIVNFIFIGVDFGLVYSLRKKQKIFLEPIGSIYAMLWFVFILWCAFTAKWAINPLESIAWSLKLLTFLHFLWLLLIIFEHSTRKQKVIGYYFFIVLLFTLVWVLVEFTEQLATQGTIRPSSIQGILTNKNNLAGLLAGMNSIILLQFASKPKNRCRKLLVTVTVVLWAILFLLLARSAILALVVSAIAVIIWNFKRVKALLPFYKKTLIAVGIGILAGFAVLLVKNQSYLTGKLKASLHTSQKQDTLYGGIQNSLKVRSILWSGSLQLLKKEPLTGVGAGNWRLAFPELGVEQLGYRVQQGDKIYQRAHNDYLQVMVETGVGGGIFFFILLAVPVFWAFVRLRNASFYVRIALQLFFLFFLIWTGLEYPSERLPFFMLFMFFVAYMFLQGHFRSIRMPKNLIMVLFLFFIGASITSVLFFSQKVAGEQMLAIIRSEGTDGWIEKYKLTDGVLSQLDGYSTPVAWYVANHYFNKKQYAKAVKFYQYAYQLNPNHLHVLHNLASCYAKLGKTYRAIDLYKKVLKLSSKHNYSLLNLSKIYYKQGKLQEARSFIKSIDWHWSETPPRDYKRLNMLLYSKQNQ